jgi:uncharacterized protein VirK/YbjX
MIYLIKNLVDASNRLFPGSRPRSLFYRWSTVTLTSFKAPTIHKWIIRNIDNSALLHELSRSRHIFKVFLVPYVNRKWSIGRKLEALEQHYVALNEEKGKLFNFDDNQYIDLVQLGHEYLNLRIVIDKPHWMRQEGEIAVSLYCGEHRIYTAMILIAGHRPHRRLIVGAIQGRGISGSKELYVKLTHALHGLRPRDFLISVLKMIAQNLECSEIHCISDECHRSSKPFSRARKQLSYNEIWEEHEGRKNSEGFFVVPGRLCEREITDIPSKKRAQYRRRYDFIRLVEQQISDQFASCACQVKNKEPKEKKHAPRPNATVAYLH